MPTGRFQDPCIICLRNQKLFLHFLIFFKDSGNLKERLISSNDLLS